MNELERREAIEAGERALQSLNAARAALHGARNWGIVDMLGGGIISTMLKRSRMQEANAAMEKAKSDLEQFRDELEDVNIQLATGDFLGFADYFFDGLIFDAVAQKRIGDASVQVDRITEQVEFLLARLING
ncbi:MAG: hypothetical protein IKV99_08445 [Oscillospiraceae bacterium]|nr:hypothetical protein [Oscillospiraceae bacterium]